MPKCPWCGKEVNTTDYSTHLEEEHYKGEPGKRTGPYPVPVKETEK